MTTKTKTIINWSLAGIVGFIFIGSGLSKILGGEEMQKMANGIGLSAETFKLLGIVELISALLFFFPRTGIIGTFLLVAYMGGAIAIHLTNDQSLVAPAILEAIIWIAAFIRFPELKDRILNLNS